MTDELLFRLDHGYQDVRTGGHPDAPPRRGDRPPAGSGQTQGRPESRPGFSGGVDSFTVLADHFYDPGVPPALRITHLSFTGLEATMMPARPRKRCSSIACNRASRFRRQDRAPSSFPLTPTSWMRIGNGTRLSAKPTSTGASVAFLLQRGVGRWLYASA